MKAAWSLQKYLMLRIAVLIKPQNAKIWSKIYIFEALQYIVLHKNWNQSREKCGDVFVSDWFQFVINIHDYLRNLRQTKHFVMV